MPSFRRFVVAWFLSILCVTAFSAVALLAFPTFASAHQLVLDHDFPDPSIVLANDGFYYAYATQGFTEDASPRIINLQLARSKNLKDWTYLGDALPVKPTWAKSTQSFWAPHIYSANNQFYLYYSANPDAGGGLCLAVATSQKPEGPFTDSGSPMICGPSYSNIDPMVVKDSATGQTLMYWGSASEPIRVRPLAPSLKEFAAGTTATNLMTPDAGATPAPYTRLYEGAWMLQHDGFYYLFFSGEDCCGQPNPQYAVLVSRATSAMGPFSFKNGNARDSLVIQARGQFSATGHNCFINDSAGQLWSFYHGVTRQHPFLDNVIPGDRVNRRVLLRSRIDFVGGWPVAK